MEMNTKMIPDKLVLFDGVCNLCSQSVQFIIKRDTQNLFYFASLQSDLGQSILEQHNMPLNDFNSFVYLENGKIYTQSDAALRLFGYLKGPIRFLSYFRFVPRFIRNGVYRLVSHYRYRIWGKKDACMIPSPELKAKFLD